MNLKNSRQSIVFRIIAMIALLSAASGLGYLFRSINFHETNIVLLYLLAVLLTAWLSQGYILGIVASVIATALFNYLFTQPYFTFAVYDPSYFITFAIMTITALVTSTLTSLVKKNAAAAVEKELETKAVYTLTNLLTDAKDIHDISAITVRALSEYFACKAALLCYDADGIPEQSYLQHATSTVDVHRKLDDITEYIHRINSVRTGFDIGPEFYDWPIYGRENILGVVRIPKEKAAQMNESQSRLLRSMIESTALAMDRFRSAEQRIKLRDETDRERFRGNLLRAISHDLRTPLSGIIGTAEMLMGMTQPDDPRYSLAEGIYKDADWLHSLVENILSLTRLQDGRLAIKKQLEAVEEVVGAAVSHISQRSPEHEVTVNVPYDLMLVPMDAKLIQQVLINLLDNAVKNTPKANEICISVIKEDADRFAVFSVRDRGTGISESDLPHIFQMFYTTRTGAADSRQGIGLGLSICEAIIKAHGGSIEAHNRSDGSGAEFVFKLPMEVVENE
jgi:two-component system sensor histidine kinase KdpD